MKGIVYHGPRDLRFETIDDPAIQQPGDAVVRVERRGTDRDRRLIAGRERRAGRADACPDTGAVDDEARVVTVLRIRPL